ncbi:MAG: type II toxin-antitoxin system RelE/ParE family toxin [Sphingomonas fennica]
MKIGLSSRAVDDLECVGKYIAEDDPVRAGSFLAELRLAILGLEEMPRRFPLVPRYERHGIRRRAWKGYAVLYSIEPDRLFVHRILGPGRDLDRALGLG